MSTRPIDMTALEWQLLNDLWISSGEDDIPNTHRVKFIRLGVAAEKAGKLKVTFEGRLQLREYNSNKALSAK